MLLATNRTEHIHIRSVHCRY